MNIAIAGTGYVGLSLAVLLAQSHQVTAVDIDSGRVDLINKWVSPIRDEYIEQYLADHEARHLHLKTTTDTDVYCNADFVIIAVPTNYNPETNYFDCSAVESVIESLLAKNAKAYIIIKSTVPVGYTERICTKYHTNKILFSPEFLRESKALYDNLYPSRIIVGCNSENRDKAEEFAGLLMQGAEKKEVPLLFMGLTEAEAVKLFANTYLALRVSYFNELDTYAEIKGLNTQSIIQGVCLDPRIGNYYNNPSFGYGGVLFTKGYKTVVG